MRYFWLFLLLISVLITGACVFGSSISIRKRNVEDMTNLVFNGGFEKFNEDNVPLGWVSLDSDKSFFSCTSSEKCEGNSSLAVRENPKSKVLISDAFEVNKNTSYYNEGFFKSNKLLGSKIRFSLVVFNKDGKNLSEYKKNVTLTDEWQKIYFNASFLKREASFARVILKLNPERGEVIYVDKIASCPDYEYYD
ncbi:MAG: hypothetical protein CSB55_01470 [Candidatus Cloacimonadota bacterium]|nr:MAG: hypothetical protein CSB55_01470 [Candidatus Cloacimonadota bacterium]